MILFFRWLLAHLWLLTSPPLVQSCLVIIMQIFCHLRPDQNKSLSSYLQCNPTRWLPLCSIPDLLTSLSVLFVPPWYLIFKRLIFLICSVSLFVIWLLYQSPQTETWTKQNASVSPSPFKMSFFLFGRIETPTNDNVPGQYSSKYFNQLECTIPPPFFWMDGSTKLKKQFSPAGASPDVLAYPSFPPLTPLYKPPPHLFARDRTARWESHTKTTLCPFRQIKTAL